MYFLLLYCIQKYNHNTNIFFCNFYNNLTGFFWIFLTFQAIFTLFTLKFVWKITKMIIWICIHNSHAIALPQVWPLLLTFSKLFPTKKKVFSNTQNVIVFYLFIYFCCNVSQCQWFVGLDLILNLQVLNTFPYSDYHFHNLE